MPTSAFLVTALLFAAVGMAHPTSASAGFCDELAGVVELAADDFNSIRREGRSSVFDDVTLVLPGAQRCVVSKRNSYYRCSWKARSSQREQQIRTLAEGIRGCYSDADVDYDRDQDGLASYIKLDGNIRITVSEDRDDGTVDMSIRQR